MYNISRVHGLSQYITINRNIGFRVYSREVDLCTIRNSQVSWTDLNITTKAFSPKHIFVEMKSSAI
jgi:hypothetical protein